MSEPAVTLNWLNKTPETAPVLGSLAQVTPTGARSYLVEGDNLQSLAALRQGWAGTFTLAYLDPPFLTGKQHLRVTRQRDQDGKIVRRLSPAFDDRWSSLSEYLGALRSRVEQVRDLLAPNGCMVLHIDPKTSHYAKVMCDEIFGPDCFASEIIWRYRRWPAKTVNFQRVHDVLLRYIKDPTVSPCFTTLYEPLAPSTQATWGDRKQRAVVDGEGRRMRSSRSTERSLGTPLGDVWDIGIVAPVSRERTGYPTQKPAPLLERLIQSCTAHGDWILDPYVGSGTTLAEAHRLGRRAVGLDNSPEALAVTRKRLADAGANVVCETLRTPHSRAGAAGPGVRKAG